MQKQNQDLRLSPCWAQPCSLAASWQFGCGLAELLGGVVCSWCEEDKKRINASGIQLQIQSALQVYPNDLHFTTITKQE